MRDVWEERRKVKEEEYFKKRDQAALDALRARKPAALKTDPVKGGDPRPGWFIFHGLGPRLRQLFDQLLRR